MPNYKMKIKGNLGLSEYSDVYDYMALVEVKDNFMITFDSSSNHEKQIITSMLEANKFNILDQGQNPTGNYYITAMKI